MAAPCIEPIRSCLYGRHIGNVRRHTPFTFRKRALGRAASAHVAERTSVELGLVVPLSE